MEDCCNRQLNLSISFNCTQTKLSLYLYAAHLQLQQLNAIQSTNIVPHLAIIMHSMVAFWGEITVLLLKVALLLIVCHIIYICHMFMPTLSDYIIFSRTRQNYNFRSEMFKIIYDSIYYYYK